MAEVTETVEAAVVAQQTNCFGGTEPVFEDQLVNHVLSEYDRRLRERQPFELQWRLNIAFIEGRQYMQIHHAASELVDEPPAYWWEERKIFNHIAPIVETRMARLGRLRPVLKARPPSPGGDDADRGAAIVSTAILQMAYEDMRIPERLRDAIPWLEATGAVILKYPWNPDAGRIIGYRTPSGDTVPSDGLEEEPNFLPDGLENLEPVREGDIEAVVCPPQEIFPESSWHDGVDATRSIIHARAYHVDVIHDEWGKKIKPEEMEVSRLQRVTAGAGGIGYGEGSVGDYRVATTQLKDHALVKEYWEMPSGRYPYGRLIIVAGRELLYAGKLPYLLGDDGKPGMPFVRIPCIHRPGCFWGRSVVERLIPLQRRYNALRNRKAEYLSRCSLGVLTYEDGSIDADMLERDGVGPGAMIPYRKGFAPPRFLDNPQLPTAFESEERTLLDELTIISGVSEIARQSKAPPGVKSGVALSIAIEQDDTRLSLTAENIKLALVESGKMWLRHYKQRVQAPRVLRQTGTQNLVPVTHWNALDIKAENVVIEGAANLVESLHQRRQMVFDLLQTPLFLDSKTGQLTPEGRARIFELLELGDWENFNDTEQLHIDRADRENAAMIKGSPREAAHYDDHVLHIAHHNRTRLMVEYEEAIANNPVVAEVFEMHIQMHLMYLQQLSQQQAQQPGAPPPVAPPPESDEEVEPPPIVEHPSPPPAPPVEAPVPDQPPPMANY